MAKNERVPLDRNMEFRIHARMNDIRSIVLSNTTSVDVPVALGEEVTITFKVVEIERTERL